jgi:hypothetical protein
MDLTKKTRRVEDNGFYSQNADGYQYWNGSYRTEVYWVDSRTGKEYSSPEHAARDQQNSELEKAQDVLQRAREHRERKANPPNKAAQVIGLLVAVFVILGMLAAAGGHR